MTQNVTIHNRNSALFSYSQGVVSGVLLVTPNAVMFDPNVSDTLVMEHGPESYGVIAPMEYVVNAAIFYDIAHMRTHGPDHNAHKWVANGVARAQAFQITLYSVLKTSMAEE